MPKVSKIQYDPTLSIADNAKINGVTEDGIRYYLKTHNIDRRKDGKLIIVNKIKDILKKKPSASVSEVVRLSGYSVNTVRRYWDAAHGKERIQSKISSKKKPKFSLNSKSYLEPHPSCVVDILREESFSDKTLEPFCGHKTLSKVFEMFEKDHVSYSPIQIGDSEQGDFFQYKGEKRDIISFMPYEKHLGEVIKKSIEICDTKVAYLMPLNYLSGTEKSFYKKYPPTRVYVYQNQILLAKDGNFQAAYSGESSSVYAWYIWEKGNKGRTELCWINNKSKDCFTEGCFNHVKILWDYDFSPNTLFKYPLNECIPFHSKASPENQVLSNHYNCIITFRGYEFYGVEQLFHVLQFSDSPEILRGIMAAKKGIEAKAYCKERDELKDWDAAEKEYRNISICHLFKYFSFKPYRDRLRETIGKELVECPNGSDNHFAAVFDYDENCLIGNNCSGRSTMMVRDIMYRLEEQEIFPIEQEFGRKLSPEEKEPIFENLYSRIKATFESRKEVKEGTDKIIDFFQKEGIPHERPIRPSYTEAMEVDKTSKCLLLDFDYTLFNTDADNALRKNCTGPKDWNAITDTISEYRLYDRWMDVFYWAEHNGVKLGIVSSARSQLIRDALEYFNIPINVVIGYRQYYEKPNAILINFALEKLGNVAKENVLYVGDSITDEMMSRAAGVRFVGGQWGMNEDSIKEMSDKGISMISSPSDIIDIFKNW